MTFWASKPSIAACEDKAHQAFHVRIEFGMPISNDDVGPDNFYAKYVMNLKSS